MERNNRPSTSRMDVNDIRHLSSAELTAKLDSFRILCLKNKINTSNAFDIDITGYMQIWLEKNGKTANCDAKLLQAIGDFLEATGKMYSFRVDSLGETTEKLVEQFRAINYKKYMLKENDKKVSVKKLKPKRSRLMILTSAEKLKRESNLTSNYVASNKLPCDFKIDFNKLFTITNRPSSYLVSLYSGVPLGEELKKCNINNKINDNSDVFNINVQKEITKRDICPEFKNFIADHDKIVDPKEFEEPRLDGIEHQFIPNNHTFINLKSDSASYTNICNESDGLLECVDSVDNDYSFFNPSQLANWQGPKFWKTQAMVKALKSSSRKETNILSFDVDGLLEEPIVKCKRKKKHNANKFKIKWSTLAEIDTYITSASTVNQANLSAVTLKKWSTMNNICDTKSITIDLTHRLSFLEYVKVQPESKKSNIINQSHMGDSVMNLPSFEEDNVKEDNMSINFRTETKMDISELKKEIYVIVLRECVIIDSKSEWSSQLPFIELLMKLRVTEREKLTIGIVFVALLHLSNEHGLKLFQKSSTINDVKEIYIARPINN